MSFLRTTPPDETRGSARRMLDWEQKRHGFIPNYARLFTDHPEILALWTDMTTALRRSVDPRRYELVTFASARALGISYCTLAHGKVLAAQFLDREEIAALASDEATGLGERDAAIVEFTSRVVTEPASVAHADVERLRSLGLREGEIFDIVAVAAARAFFGIVVEGLGVQADSAFLEMEPALLERLTVGRPIAREPGTCP